jgi:predicted alpha/beta-fold hydrolase
MVDPIVVELFNYASSGVSFLLFLTLLIFIPLLICQCSKISKLKFLHSQKSRLKRIPYFTNLHRIKFTPSIFFPSGNMQTVVLPFFTFKEYGRKHLWSYQYKREFLKLSDGGQIALDWVQPREPSKASRIDDDETPILAVVPGLTGHNDDLYMVSTSLASVEAGYKMVMINHRG